MKKSISIAVWMAFVSIVMKLTLYTIGVEVQNNITYTAFFNILVISVGTFFGVRRFKINNRPASKFGDEVKAGLRIGALYALIMAIFVYVYYSYIDTAYFASLIESRLAVAREAVDQGQEVNFEKVKETVEFVFSPKTHATITMFGFLVAGAIYSLLITYFMRKIPGYK